jgi:phospholipase/carboxylesterase
MSERDMAVLSALLQAVHSLAFVSRHLHPEHLPDLVGAIGAPDDALREALTRLAEAEYDADWAPVRGQMLAAAEATLAGYDEVRAAAEAHDLRGAMRATRRELAALEALFPLAPVLPPISGFFLEPDARADAALRARLAARAENSGIMHAANAREERGGFSLFVPESYRPDVAHPLVVALHGGSGHGRSFLWHWVRAARSRGAIVLSPTARGSTWSLAGPDMDSDNLAHMLDFVRARWNIDPARLLLAGMSDGGTFAMLTGLRDASPFTHLAPCASAFHPMLVRMSSRERLGGLPIYLVHGEQDWMFPVELAREADEALRAFGADVTYRELADLAHVFPREECAPILDWLAGPTRAP